MNSSKLLVRVIGAAWTLSCLTMLTGTAAQSAPEMQTVKITARKFDFTPKVFHLKKGVPVKLLLSSDDRTHGFNIPALSERADIEPDKVTELKITPVRAGELDFFCDVFCGNGHEAMSGKIIVDP